MEESDETEEYDSDSTVLLTDFADKPKKIDAKRRRLSNLHDRSKQSGQDNENIPAPNESGNDLPELGSPDDPFRNWRIAKYFSCNNDINYSNLENNISNDRRNDEISHKHAPEQSNSEIEESNIVTSSESQSNKRAQIMDLANAWNDRMNNPKIIVLKPAAINARRSTVDIIVPNKIHSESNISQTQDGNQPKLRVMKPSVINERRATTHFEQNKLGCSLNNENNNIINEESENDKLPDIGCSAMDDLESSVANTTSNTRAEIIPKVGAGVETQGVKTLSTVTSNSVNNTICNNTISQNLRQNTVCKNVTNSKAHKRLGEIESQIEPKRTKTNMKQKRIDFPSSVNYNKIKEIKENAKVFERGKFKVEEHVKRDERKAMSNIVCAKNDQSNGKEASVKLPLATSINQDLTYGVNKTQPKSLPTAPVGRQSALESNNKCEKEALNSVTLNKECNENDTNITNVVNQGVISSDKQNTSEVHAKEVISKGYDRPIITIMLDEPVTNGRLEAGRETTDRNDTSNMQEDQDTNKKLHKQKSSDVRENGRSEVQDRTIVDKYLDQDTSSKNDERCEKANEELMIHSSNNVEKIIENENQNKSKVFKEVLASEAGVGLVTNKLQDKQVTDHEVLFETSGLVQETINPHGELEMCTIKEKQTTNLPLDNSETEKPQAKLLIRERLDKETIINDKIKDITSEQETQEVRHEQITSEQVLLHDSLEKEQNITSNRSFNACVIGSEHMSKFQLWFFTKTIDHLKEMHNNITKTNPESGIILNNIIKTLQDAKNKTDQTDVEYSCPQCGCVSNFSSSSLEMSEADGHNPNAVSSQNCRFCCYIRKLHNTYLKRHLNKIYRNANNKEAVRNTLQERCNSLTHTHENTRSDLVSTSEAKVSISNSTLEKEKQMDDFTSTQSCLDAQKTNNVRNDCIQTSKCDTSSSSDKNKSVINVVSTEANPNRVKQKELSDDGQDTSITFNYETTGENKLTRSNVKEVKSIANEAKISNKRTSADEQTISHKRMKTAADNDISQTGPNLQTMDNSLYLTKIVQRELSVIENIKETCLPAHRSSNSIDELPSNIVSDKEDVMPENGKESIQISAEVIGSHNEGEPEDAINSDTAEKISNEKASSNKGTNENTTKLKASSAELVENDNSIKKASNGSITETITICNISRTDSPIRNTEKNDKNSEIILKSLENCLTTLKHGAVLYVTKETEDSQKKVEVRNEPLLKSASKRIRNPRQSCGRTYNNNLVVSYKYICPNCTSMYSNASKLLLHLKNKHNSEATDIPEMCIKFQCPFCKKLLLNNYNKHVVRCSVNNSNDNRAKNMVHGSNKIKDNNHEDIKRERKRSKLPKYKYNCAVCDEALSTYNAARQHRQQIHPELKHQHIIKRARIGDKVVTKQNKNRIQRSDNTHTNKPDDEPSTSAALNAEDDDKGRSIDETNDLDTSSEGEDISSSDTSESNTSQDSSRYEDEDSCYSDDSWLYSGETSDDTSDEESNDRSDEDEGNTIKANNKGTSTDSNRSHLKKYIYKCLICNTILYSDYASRKHRATEHPNMRRVPIFRRIKTVKPDSNEKRSKESDSNNKEKDKVSKMTKINRSPNTSDSDWSTDNTPDCIDATYTRNNSEESSCNEEVRANKYRNIAKRRKRAAAIKEYTANEESSDSDWIIDENNYRSDDSEDEVKDSDHSRGQITGTDEINDESQKLDENALPGSDDETVKTSTYTTKKRKERFSKLFGNDNENDNDGEVQQSEENVNEEIDNECENNNSTPKCCGNVVPCDGSDDETIKVSENTIKKRKQRLSFMFDDGVQQEQSVALDEEKRPPETSELAQGTGPRQYEEGPNQQERNKEASDETIGEHCDMNLATVQNKNTETNLNALNNANATRDHDDRIEIDMINSLLDEYNSQTPDAKQNNLCVQKENDIQKNKEPNPIEEQPSETNTNSQDTLQSNNIVNCFENVQITNVRRIENQLVTFICQECAYATDRYDDTIRHCQNHYNDIKDPVTYCNICRIKYDTSCFKSHQAWHDKHFENIKIKFSYHWLFSNWQAIFENNNMSLRKAEEMQKESIYKTHGVKMTVKDAGPWQSAIYLCAKCNTYVSPREIENHVHSICTFKNFPCNLCNRAFTTHEMREHHQIYHVDETQSFKTIVFNEVSDESFNSKLFQAKSKIDKQKEQNIDIFKCMCGLCFNSLKNFKLHFVDCDTQTNNGVKCTRCPGDRRFLPTDIEEHLSLHDSIIKRAFRIQQITFQQECDYNRLEHNESTSDNATQTEPNDAHINMNKDMLNSDSLPENTVRPISLDEVLNIKRHILKDESLSQSTNREYDLEDVNADVADTNSISTTGIATIGSLKVSQHATDEEINIKRDMLKDESLSQNIIEGNVTEQIGTLGMMATADEDLNIKRDMLKDEALSQDTQDIEENIHVETDAFKKISETSTVEKETTNVSGEDLNVKREMLKGELLSQDTFDENTQGIDTIEGNLESNIINRVALMTIDEDLDIKRDMLKNESLSQDCIEDAATEKIDTFDGMLDTGRVENQILIATNDDLNIKREMLKEESLSQQSVQDGTQENIDIVNEHLIDSCKAENVKDTTQENNEEKKPENNNTDIDQLEIGENSDVIVIEDSDDDVEVIEENKNEFKFARRRAYTDSNNWELLI